MHPGSIRLWVLALVVAAVAALAPDLGPRGSVAAQVVRPPSGTAPRTGLPPANPTAGGATVPGADQPAADPLPLNTILLPISGRVVADDGSSLGHAAAVETVCNGVERVEAFTDSRGGFSFQFGERNPGVFQDASIPQGGPAARLSAPSRASSRPWDLMSCDLKAKVPGFLSESIRLSWGDSNVGAILVHRMGRVEGNVISVASLAAPKEARKAFDRGEERLGRREFEEARRSFEKAVEIYPGYASAWQELGRIQLASRQTEQARGSFEAAIKADPEFIGPYLALALIEEGGREWTDLLGTTNRALKLDPYGYPQAYYLNAVANYNLQNLDAAENSAREAEKLDPHGRFPGTRRLLGLILVDRRDYVQAADQMRGFLQFAPDSPHAAEVRTQLSEIERSTADRSQDPDN
jgi:tetratricopeptide (TPR) repeat protein